MRYRLAWSRTADGRLMVLADFLADRSRASASRMVRRIRDALLVLEEHPEAGPLWFDSEDMGIRRFIVDDYVVYYEVEPEQRVIKIHSLHHGKESPPDPSAFQR